MIIQRHELAFARRAVRQGVVSGEQILECIELLRKKEQQYPTSLKETLIRLGYANSKAIEEIESSFATKSLETIKEQQTILGGYLLLQKLGEGAMGSVYKAEHIKNKKIVAIKLLDQELAEDKGFISRFLREAKNAAKLKHPNIVAAYDIGKHNEKYYFVMEFVDGCSLAHIIYKKGSIAEKQALIIAKQIAQALVHAHSFSIVHRDIKPENILYSSQGIIKLCDLGLAKDISQDLYYSSGMTVGTLGYASPEQAKGEKSIDIRTDIYSLGICLYQMLTGKVPFEDNKAKLQIPEFTNFSPNIESLLLNMLHPDREYRYQTPLELLEDINKIICGENIKQETLHPGETQAYRKSQIILTKRKIKVEWAWEYKLLIIAIVTLILFLLFR